MHISYKKKMSLAARILRQNLFTNARVPIWNYQDSLWTSNFSENFNVRSQVENRLHYIEESSMRIPTRYYRAGNDSLLN